MKTSLKNKQQSNNANNVIDFKKYKGFAYNRKTDVKSVDCDDFSLKVKSSHRKLLEIKEIADCLLKLTEGVIDLNLDNYILIKGDEAELTKDGVYHLINTCNKVINDLKEYKSKLETKIL